MLFQLNPSSSMIINRARLTSAAGETRDRVNDTNARRSSLVRLKTDCMLHIVLLKSMLHNTSNRLNNELIIMNKVTALSLSFLLSFGMTLKHSRAEDGQITLALTTRNGSTSLPFVIAEEKGFFKSEGLNAIVVIMQNQVVVNGVVTRNVDYGGTFSNFVGAALSGLPVRIVMSAMDGSDHYLVTASNIKKVEDLKGKTFGISSFGGTPHSEAIMILRKYGMNPEKDVTFLQIGGSSSRYTALESGSIQAAMLVPPFNNFAKKRGFNQLMSFNDIMSIPLGALSVHTQKIKEKPDEIIRMIKAVLKSTDYISNRKSDILSFM